ncbi:MAG: pitrilysin family protein [Pseudomonadota bacterium]
MFSDAQKRKLPNGLTVLVRPDRCLPVACVLTWVNVGYFNEPDPLTGISHYIEHLFFKGTPSRGVGAVAKETKEIGGYLNASTIYDSTYYYTVFRSRNLAKALEIQSDALLNPLFDAEEMAKEKEVIIQELKRKCDNPDPYAWEKLMEMSFRAHRIRRWRMGTEKEIRSYSRDDVLAFYDRYYRPGNTILAVVGDFDPEEAFARVEERYGVMPGRAVDREGSPPEPVQTEPHMSRITGDISQPLVKLGFHAPSLAHGDFHAMNFLSVLLGRGRSSRLYRSLKEEKRLVEGVGTALYASADVGFLTVEMELKPEQIAETEEEVFSELDRLEKDPPTPEEIERVRNIVEANFFAEKEDVMGQAYGLAYFESLGGYEKSLEYVERMRAVSSRDLVRVAREYLRFSRMNLLEYVPKRVGAGAPAEQRLESLQKRVAARLEKVGPAVPPHETPPASPIVFAVRPTEPIHKAMEPIQIPGGITLLHLQTKALPLASAAVYFPGGRLDETESNCGLTQFLLDGSLKGTEHRTAEEIAFGMESLGSAIRVEATADIFGYSMSLLSRNLEQGMDLISDVILHPTFPDREIEVERAATLAGIRRVKDDPFRRSIELFYKALYGHHPYGLPRNGTEASVEAFQRDQITDWYDQVFGWKKMVVAVVGDVERQRAVDLVGERFSVAKDAAEQPRAQIIPVLPDRGLCEETEERDRKQTSLVIGFSGVSLKDERYFSLEVLRNILSGMGGRLFMELREKRALAYSVAAFNIGLLRGGAFFTYAAGSPDLEGEIKMRLASELERAKKRAPAADELEASKAYTQGSHAIALQGNTAQAFIHLHHFMVGRGLEAVSEYEKRVQDVNAEQVRHVAAEIIDLDRAAVGIVRGRPA